MTARQAPEHLVPEVRIGEEDANGVYSGLRADPQAWWAFLRTLVHFDPNYPYNPEYEYGPTWTDDPRYVADSVRRLMGTQYWVTVCSFWLTLKRVWGSRIQIERRILIPQGIRDELSTDSPYRVEMEGVVPDGVVTAHSLPEDQRSLTVRRHDPEHPDQLYLEVVSRTERDVQRDIRHKLEVYEALGIREYLLYDLFRRLGDRPRLYLYRLGGEGNPTYAKVVPVRWADGHPAYHSEVLDRKIRMLPANDRGGALDPVDTDDHRFQLWEPVRGVWWDPEVEVQLNLAASRADGRVQGQIDARRNLLADMPAAPEESVAEVLDTLERNWRRTGKIPPIAQIVEVAPGRRSWRELLSG